MSLKLVNFGSGKGGLSTVGYTIYGVNGAEVVARSTAGVVEIGTSTGIYAANVTLPDYDAIVLWDTGEATPKYATEDYQHQIQDLVDNTGRIPNIYNSIKYINESFALLMDRLGLIQKNEGLVKVEQKIDDLAKRENISLSTMEEIFNKATSKIQFPAIEKTPDYSGSILELSKQLSALRIELDRIPKSSKDYTFNLSVLGKQIAELEKNLKPQKELLDSYQNNIKLLNSKLNNLSSSLEGVASSLVVLGNDTKDEERKTAIIREIKGLSDFLRRLAMTQNDMNILATFGHKR